MLQHPSIIRLWMLHHNYSACTEETNETSANDSKIKQIFSFKKQIDKHKNKRLRRKYIMKDVWTIEFLLLSKHNIQGAISC